MIMLQIVNNDQTERIKVNLLEHYSKSSTLISYYKCALPALLRDNLYTQLLSTPPNY